MNKLILTMSALLGAIGGTAVTTSKATACYTWDCMCSTSTCSSCSGSEWTSCTEGRSWIDGHETMSCAGGGVDCSDYS